LIHGKHRCCPPRQKKPASTAGFNSHPASSVRRSKSDPCRLPRRS
jgi:hypothetical protein